MDGRSLSRVLLIQIFFGILRALLSQSQSQSSQVVMSVIPRGINRSNGKRKGVKLDLWREEMAGIVPPVQPKWRSEVRIAGCYPKREHPVLYALADITLSLSQCSSLRCDYLVGRHLGWLGHRAGLGPELGTECWFSFRIVSGVCFVLFGVVFPGEGYPVTGRLWSEMVKNGLYLVIRIDRHLSGHHWC